MKLNADYKTLYKLWYKMKSTMEHEEWHKECFVNRPYYTDIKKFIGTPISGVLWNAELYVMLQCVIKKKAQIHLVEVKCKCNMFVWFWLEFPPEKWDMEALNILLHGLYATDCIIMYTRGTVYGMVSMYFTFFGMGLHNVFWYQTSVELFILTRSPTNLM